MPERRTTGFHIGGLLIVAFLAITLFGCPPSQIPQVGPDQSEEISQAVLDSLRADSLQKCRFHRSFAYNYARSNLRSDAINQFQKALNYCTGDIRAEVERYYAGYLDDWGMTDSAFVHYCEAGRLDTTNARVHFWLYSYYHDSGEYDKAIDELMIAARYQEDADVKVRWMMVAAEMMAAEDDADRVCETYARLHEIAPDNGVIATRMIEAGCVSSTEELLATLRSACAADTLSEICWRLAREEGNYGNDANAFVIYQRFAQNDPNNMKTWERLLRTARRIDNRPAILEALRALARIEPNVAQRHAQLADELFARRDWNGGAAVLLPALMQYPQNAHLLYLAGLYYTRPGTSTADTTQALEYLDRAVLTNDPDWHRTALGLHDMLEPPLSGEEINQAKFFGKKVERLHRCRIPGREKQNEVLD